ncbi:hypothetical protein Ancab_006037, partial [Ancistrocladus abbreviatus]
MDGRGGKEELKSHRKKRRKRQNGLHEQATDKTRESETCTYYHPNNRPKNPKHLNSPSKPESFFLCFYHSESTQPSEGFQINCGKPENRNQIEPANDEAPKFLLST